MARQAYVWTGTAWDEITGIGGPTGPTGATGATGPTGPAPSGATINSQTGTSYTFVIDDAGKLVTLSNTSAITVTVPPNSSVAFGTGTQISLASLNTGIVTVAPGAGVTINSYGGYLALAAQYAAGMLIKTDTNTWLLTGNLA